MTGACLVIGATASTTAAQAYTGPGWQHALRVVQRLRERPPQAPAVVLLGGSAAREATVRDASWAAAVSKLSGSRVVTRDLGSQNQTFEQDVALVKALPQTRAPMLVFIGINRGRFADRPTITTSTTPVAGQGVYRHHHYHRAHMWSLARKQAKVRRWMRVSYPAFEARFAANLAQLAALISVCQQRGYYPVVLDLPRNSAAIGDGFDAPDQRFLSASRELAAQCGIPFLDFVDDVGLVNRDFYDLDHLLDSGWPKFQGRLAQETARLLESYAAPAGAAVRGGTSQPTASPAAAAASGAGSQPWEASVAVVVVLGGAVAGQRGWVVARRRRRGRERQPTGDPHR